MTITKNSSDKEDINNLVPNICTIKNVVDIKTEKEITSIIVDDKKSLFDDSSTENLFNTTDNTAFVLNKSKDSKLKQLLINLRDNEISKEFVIDKRCVLSPLMIEQFIKYKPLNRDEFQNKISLRIRQSIDSEQMLFIDDVFEILEMTYE